MIKLLLAKVHIHEHHGPNARRSGGTGSEHGITQLYNFSLVICRHPGTGKYLLCQEFADQGFWCPGQGDAL